MSIANSIRAQIPPIHPEGYPFIGGFALASLILFWIWTPLGWIGTVLTVAMYYQHFESVAVTVAIALIIATVKASLVAGFFMHLVSERKPIYAILVFTAFFFAGLMGLLIWSMHDNPDMTQSLQTAPPAAAAPAQHVP